MPKLACGFAVWLALAPAGTAGDWPQWRGPDRDAVWPETGLPETFPPGGLKIAWRVPIRGGFASPIVAGGRVYVTDWEVTKSESRERILCYDERTGERLWVYAGELELPAGFYDPVRNPGPCPTPLVAEGLLVNMGATGNVTCLEAASGRLVWKRALGQDYGLQGYAELTACPLVEAGLVIVAIGGKPEACVVALDLHTGKEVWHALDDPYTFSSPLVITAAGHRQLIVWTPRAVNSLDPATGHP
jgi:outer membrane protein assembly factor BamB